MQEIQEKAIKEGIIRQNKPRIGHKPRSKAAVFHTPDPSTKSSASNLKGNKKVAPYINQAPREEEQSSELPLKLPALPVPTLVNEKPFSLPPVENEEQMGHNSAEATFDNSQHVDKMYEPYQIWEKKGEDALIFFMLQLPQLKRDAFALGAIFYPTVIHSGLNRLVLMAYI